MADFKRTQVAQAAFDFAGYFTATFGAFQIGGSVIRSPVLVAPQDMSTGGGKKALQHIILQGPVTGVPTVTVGWIDLAQSTMMMRTYGCLVQLHQARFGNRPFDLDPITYQSFFDRANEWFASQGMRMQVEDRSALPAPAPAPAGSSKALLIGAVVALAIFGLVASVAFVLLYLRHAN